MLIYKSNNLKGSKIMTNYTYIYSDYDINSDGKAPISVNNTVKILIPRKFGGSFVKAKYIGYGFFKLKSGKFISDRYIAALLNDEDFPELLKHKFGTENAFEGLNTEGQLMEIGIYGADYLGDVKGMIAEFPVKIIKGTSSMTYEECRFHIVYEPDLGINYKFEHLETYPGFLGGYLEYMEYLKEVANGIKALKKRNPFIEERIKLELKNKHLLNYMKKISQEKPIQHKKIKNIFKLIEFNNQRLLKNFYVIESDIVDTLNFKIKKILERPGISWKIIREQLLKIQEDISTLAEETSKRQVNDLKEKEAIKFFEEIKNLKEKQD